MFCRVTFSLNLFLPLSLKLVLSCCKYQRGRVFLVSVCGNSSSWVLSRKKLHPSVFVIFPICLQRRMTWFRDSLGVIRVNGVKVDAFGTWLVSGGLQGARWTHWQSEIKWSIYASCNESPDLFVQIVITKGIMKVTDLIFSQPAKQQKDCRYVALVKYFCVIMKLLLPRVFFSLFHNELMSCNACKLKLWL